MRLQHFTIFRPNPFISIIRKVGGFFREYYIISFRVLILIEFPVSFNHLGIIHRDKVVFAILSVEFQFGEPGIVGLQNIHPEQVFIVLRWFHSLVTSWLNQPAFCLKAQYSGFSYPTLSGSFSSISLNL